MDSGGGMWAEMPVFAILPAITISEFMEWAFGPFFVSGEWYEAGSVTY
jgi:hypothetical protein